MMKHAEILTHMLGAGSHIKKSNHGYRNRYCAEFGATDYTTLVEMESLGLVVAGPTINQGRDRYFAATLAGCQAIGLSKAAIKRAMED